MSSKGVGGGDEELKVKMQAEVSILEGTVNSTESFDGLANKQLSPEQEEELSRLQKQLEEQTKATKAK